MNRVTRYCTCAHTSSWKMSARARDASCREEEGGAAAAFMLTGVYTVLRWFTHSISSSRTKYFFLSENLSLNSNFAINHAINCTLRRWLYINEMHITHKKMLNEICIDRHPISCGWRERYRKETITNLQYGVIFQEKNIEINI